MHQEEGTVSVPWEVEEVRTCSCCCWCSLRGGEGANLFLLLVTLAWHVCRPHIQNRLAIRKNLRCSCLL